MHIKSSATLRNEYNSVSTLAHQTGEPIFITKNGEGDIVVMSVTAFDEKEKQITHRAKVLEAEFSRIAGEKTYSIDEIKNHLAEKYENATI